MGEGGKHCRIWTYCNNIFSFQKGGIVCAEENRHSCPDTRWACPKNLAELLEQLPQKLSCDYGGIVAQDADSH